MRTAALVLELADASLSPAILTAVYYNTLIAASHTLTSPSDMGPPTSIFVTPAIRSR